MAIVDGRWIPLRRDREGLHRMTFTACHDSDPARLAASRARGAALGLPIAHAKARGEWAPDPIVDMDATDFLVWLAKKEDSEWT